ncbi:hypothetical protein H0R90_02900 [Treponema putidum]|nr:hypothetical protein [Treponema putidum]TWI77751.1 hypothetical protein JM98_01059 [Treponema putidum]
MDKEEWLLNLKDNEYPLTTINQDKGISKKFPDLIKAELNNRKLEKSV